MGEIGKARIKAALGQALYGSGYSRIFFRDKFLITAFHRVNASTLGDGLSCSPAAFREICVWLAKHFRVVPLDEQIAALERGETPAGTASITFDDGYLDNYAVAAPILTELKLPATFFITTDLIESDFVPPWDAARGTRTEWMSWAQVEELAAAGFHIESHTCTHIDLGTADVVEVERQLRASHARLNSGMLSSRRLFAYPFGGRDNIRRETVALVEETGYRCCLSCYGGINSGESDIYNLQRFPVNEQYRYPDQLGLELLRSDVLPAPRRAVATAGT